jgi:hypothetical protein
LAALDDVLPERNRCTALVDELAADARQNKAQRAAEEQRDTDEIRRIFQLKVPVASTAPGTTT